MCACMLGVSRVKWFKIVSTLYKFRLLPSTSHKSHIQWRAIGDRQVAQVVAAQFNSGAIAACVCGKECREGTDGTPLQIGRRSFVSEQTAPYDVKMTAARILTGAALTWSCFSAGPVHWNAGTGASRRRSPWCSLFDHTSRSLERGRVLAGSYNCCSPLRWTTGAGGRARAVTCSGWRQKAKPRLRKD